MFLQQLLNGITQGGTYALVALGYTLIFGVLEIINLAHGEVFMVGAMAGYALVTLAGWGLAPALLGGMAAAALLGALLEFTALRALRRKGVSNLAPLISTIGLGMVIQNLMIRVAGAEPLPLRIGGLADGVWKLGPVQVTYTQLLVLGVSLLLMVVLQWTLSRTRLGRAVRAVSESPQTAGLLGVNVSAVVLGTVMLASALGGAAGVLVGISFVSVSAVMGLGYGLKGLAVIILGGLGNVGGAVAGGLLIGVLEAMTIGYGGPFAGYKDAVAFGFLFLLLVLRPQGLFGQGAAVTRRS